MSDHAPADSRLERTLTWVLVALSVLIPFGWLAWAWDYATKHSESSTASLSFLAAIPLAISSVVALWLLAWVLVRMLRLGASGIRHMRGVPPDNSARP